MSVLHPVGPEEPQTYWIRRALVVAAVLVVLAVIVALVVNAASSGTAVQADPSPSTSAVVVATPTPSMMSPTAASPAATDSATSSSSATAKAKATAKSTKKASSKPTATATKTPSVATCGAGDLRVSLDGDHRLKTKKPNKFALSVTNTSAKTCLAKVTGKNFQLRIYSGKDRIWSTNDCSTAIKSVNSQLKTDQAVAWTQTWNGRRSRDDCKNRPEIPQAGTYIVTAKLDGAKAVQMRMILV